MIAVRKVVRSLTAAMPGWLLVICGVCLAIPAASAWKGGKSHGRCDESPAGGDG